MRYLFFVCCIYLISCDQERKFKAHNKHFEDIHVMTNNVKPFSISGKPVIYEVPINESDVQIESLIDTASYIQLETKPESLIGDIDRLLFYKNYIIVVDKLSAESIYLFDTLGKFVRKIAMTGKGLNDFKTITNVGIDERSENIVVFDNKVSKFFYFDLTGKLIKTVKLGLRFADFLFIGADSLLLFNNDSDNDHLKEIDNYCLLMSEGSNKIFYKDFYTSPILEDFPWFGTNHLSYNNGNITFFQRFSDTVYRITTDGKKNPLYTFKLPNPMPTDFLYNDKNRKMFRTKAKEKGYTFFMGEFYENSTHIIARYIKGYDESKTIFINKSNNEVMNVRSVTNTKFYFPSFAHPISINRDKFVGVLYSNKLLEIQNLANNKDYKIDLSENVKRLVMKVAPNDNPIVMIYSLKRN